MAGGQISQLIRMIEQLPEEQGQQLLKKLFVKDPVTAIRILQKHFSFDDLVYANDSGLSALIDALGEDTVAAALVGTQDRMVRRFADQFGTAKARTFIEDIDTAQAFCPGDRSISQGGTHEGDVPAPVRCSDGFSSRYRLALEVRWLIARNPLDIASHARHLCGVDLVATDQCVAGASQILSRDGMFISGSLLSNCPR